MDLLFIKTLTKKFHKKNKECYGDVFKPDPFLLFPKMTHKENEIISTYIALLISCVSAYLAWSCNRQLSFGKRVSMTLLAFLFGMFYLVNSIPFITTKCANDVKNPSVIAVST